MSRIFESYPLPWKVSSVLKSVNTVLTDYFQVLVDATGKEVPIGTRNFLDDLIEITQKLTATQKRRLGQSARSTELFAVKNTQDGKFIGANSSLLQYAKLWRTKWRAETRASRLNGSGPKTFVVVEVKMAAA